MATLRKKPTGKTPGKRVLPPSDRAQSVAVESKRWTDDKKVKARPCRSAQVRRLGGASWWTALTLEAAIVALLIAILCVTVAKGDEKGRPYGNDYAAAYRDSRTTAKPLLVLVSAEWCAPCQEIMSSSAAEFPRRGCFVRLDWDRDQQTIQDVLPSERVMLPSLWIWERDSKGQWSRRSFHGAPAIRGWIRLPQRPPYVIPPPAMEGRQ
jgi:hypothetical protein